MNEERVLSPTSRAMLAPPPGVGTPLRAPGKGRVLARLGWAGENVVLVGATRNGLNDRRRSAMNARRAIVMSLGISLVVSGMMVIIGQPFSVKAQEMKRYQYRIVEVLHDTDTMQRTLNEFGGSGWELVAVSAGDLTSPRMIFKK